MRSTLPIELISVQGGGGGGGGGLIWSFVDTLEFRPYANKGHYCTDKILDIYQQNMEKNCVFPTQNYEIFGSLGSNAFFFFSSFRLVGVLITKQINQNTDILYRQNMSNFYQQDIID